MKIPVSMLNVCVVPILLWAAIAVGPAAALAQSTPAAPPTGWTYRFTDDQIKTLRDAGCIFDQEDKLFADKLAARGFTAEQYVRAYQQWARIGNSQKARIQAVIVFQDLRMPLTEYRDYEKYAAEGGGLTDFYNRRLGGRGLTIAGGILSGTGLIFTIVGAAEIAAARDLARKSLMSDLTGASAVIEAEGIALLSCGIVGLGVGVPLLAVGASRMSRWAPDGALENDDVNQLKEYQISSLPQAPVAELTSAVASVENGSPSARYAMGVAPYGDRDAPGLQFVLRF